MVDMNKQDNSNIVFKTLYSPYVRRNPITSKWEVVTEEELAEKKKRAEELGLRWYI